jgi:hypothetical protein
MLKERELDRRLPLVKGRPRLGPCVATPSKFVASDSTYRPRGNGSRSRFCRLLQATTCIVGANDNVMVPKD